MKVYEKNRICIFFIVYFYKLCFVFADYYGIIMNIIKIRRGMDYANNRW